MVVAAPPKHGNKSFLNPVQVVEFTLRLSIVQKLPLKDKIGFTFLRKFYTQLVFTQDHLISSSASITTDSGEEFYTELRKLAFRNSVAERMTPFLPIPTKKLNKLIQNSQKNTVHFHFFHIFFFLSVCVGAAGKHLRVDTKTCDIDQLVGRKSVGKEEEEEGNLRGRECGEGEKHTLTLESPLGQPHH